MRPSSRTWLLVAVSVPLFFVGLGRVALIDPDEPYYAVPALEMLKTGIWQVPVLHGAPWFDKPVFFYWLVLAAYLVIGVSETAARIGSALAAVGGMLILSRYDHGGDRAARTASYVGALVLGTSLEYALLGRAAVTDMTLTFFLTLGMFAVARFLVTERLRWTALAGGAFGLATLTKGPAGFVLPAAALGLYLVLSRRTVLLRWGALASGVAAFVLTAGPWYAYMAIAHRQLLTETFLGEGNLGRFLNPEHQPLPFFYVFVLIAGMLPWSSALPAAFADALRPSAWKGERLPRATPGPLFALCWFGGILIVFSVSASKLLTYILPAFPPAALLLASYWTRALPVPIPPDPERTRPKGPIISATAGVVLAAVIALAAARAVHRGEAGMPSLTIVLMASVLATGAICAWIAVLRRSLRGLIASHAATTTLLVLAGVYTAAPQLALSHSARGLVEILERQGIADEVHGAYRERGFSLDFYLERTLPRARGLKALESLVRDKPGRIWVVSGPDVRAVTSDARLRPETVAVTPAFSAMRLFPAAGARDAGPSQEGAGADGRESKSADERERERPRIQDTRP